MFEVIEGVPTATVDKGKPTREHWRANLPRDTNLLSTTQSSLATAGRKPWHPVARPTAGFDPPGASRGHETVPPPQRTNTLTRPGEPHDPYPWIQPRILHGHCSSIIRTSR